MMSLIDLDDDQRWVPTHVNVTVLCARGLRTKSKHGSRYLYTIIQVGKEKYTTGLVDKADVPQWNEECCFELLPGILEDGGRSSFPPGSGDLVLTVMHRVLIGLDVFLGQTIIPLDKIFQEGTCPRDEWFKLHSKVGRKEKERGELQVTVQFTRNNMTASMFDLTMKDKPRSAFGKLKDRVTGRKRGDLESSSAIVPGRYAALSASTGQSFGMDMGGVAQEVEVPEEKRSKMKDFFKGKLRKSSDTRSCSSLASDSSLSSMASDNPPPSLDLLSDPPSSPIYTSKVRVEPHYGEADLARKVLTSQHTTKVLTHKRALSDEASKITTAVPRSVESLKGQTMTQSKSSLCINGSHVYDSEPLTPKVSGPLPSKLVLLEKCAPLSRSLQNLTKKSDEKSLFSEGRRWSFDKTKKEEKDEDKGQSSPPLQKSPMTVSSATASPEKGRKFRKTLFSGGRSDSLPTKSESSQATSTSEGRLRGWFSSSDSQNKPRLEVSPKVESSSDVPPPLPARSPVPPLPPMSLIEGDHANPFTTPPSSSPSSTPLSPSNPFFSHLQRNPFFEELIESQSPPFTPTSLSDSSLFHYTAVPSRAFTSISYNEAAIIASSIKRERPKPVPRQTSLPALLPKASNPSDPSGPRSLSESAEEWEESFDVFASSRINSPKTTSQRRAPLQKLESAKLTHAQGFQPAGPPPLPPRRPLRTPVSEIYSDGWLHRGQELAVHKEAYLLSQTGVASRQHGKEAECKSNGPGFSKDLQLPGNKTSNIQTSTRATSPGFATEEKLKYAPLQDDFDCWGGMLFEQDLYGRVCTGKYVPTSANSHLSLRSEILAAEKKMSKPSGSIKRLGSEMSVEDHLQMPPAVSKLDVPLIDCSPPPVEETLECPLTPMETCLDNNITFSLTLGDLNMNNSDFGFIDSDGSSHSDIVDCYKGQNGLGRTLHANNPESQQTTPEEIFHLKDTYIPEMNSSFEVSTNTLSNISSIGPDTCQDCLCDFQNVALNGNARVTLKETSNVESKQDSVDNDLVKAQTSVDDNGNLQGKVVSARLRPKGVTNANSNSNSNSPRNQSKHGDGEFEQFLSLVQNISQEGPLSYQPRSALVTMRALDKHIDVIVNNIKKSGQQSTAKAPAEHGTVKKDSVMSFEDFHAKVAPTSRTPCRILSEPSPSIPSALSLTADHQAKLCPPSVCGPSFNTSVTTFTSCTTCPPDQPLVDAHHSLLPEETQPASNLPQQESRTHPVKPLTSSQSEKKEGRSVLEMLKSTISPGRASQLATAEPEKAPEVTVDVSQYQDMTNMELISLLLQQEMDMQKQQAASERQTAQLEKCELELKKVKAQVRDLEDYIDNLLLRIMEQTPTLLQVRTRHK